MKPVYITAAAVFLPGEPVSNEQIEDFLGKVGGKPSSAKKRILQQNGIRSRHYALNENGQSLTSNARMAAQAIKASLERSSLRINSVQLLCAGTTQADMPVPGFASQVHGELNIPACELASFQSVCASGVMALKSAFLQISTGDKDNAVVCASEFASRLFKASRFERQGVSSLDFDTEFLRWMLSDGAGAFVLQDEPAPSGLSLRIEWIDIKSHAPLFPFCMYAGIKNNREENSMSWLDYPDFESASAAGAINLKQDIRLLDEVVKTGIAHYFELIDQGKINPGETDWLCCHYSSEFFRKPILELMEKGGGLIPESKWFSNLIDKGNTGSASIFIMLEELMYSGKLKVGDNILCMVPESGRFLTSFFKLRVCGKQEDRSGYTIRQAEAPPLQLKKNEISEWLIRQLSIVWIEFEQNLTKVPIVEKIHSGTLSHQDYLLLLHDLRQQVIDGSQWISRAASNIDIELFDLRSAFIRHTATEHKDYQMLERNFSAMGEPVDKIQTGRKNIGSLALSSFIFQQASKQNPIDLLGAMFIIEGVGMRLASFWGSMMKEQLRLRDEQVSFFTYHGKADENHFHRLEKALEHPSMNFSLAEKIVKTAKTTARLYQLQLEELGNY
jgi:3-oxoacyl-[acyl-carrier-protein] synthase-3